MAASFPTVLHDDDFPFRVVSHLIPVHSFREYPEAIIDETKDLFLAVKQYIPLLNQHHNGSDPATIISAGGVGFLKETYEPLFEAVLRKSSSAGFNIRSIWIADPFNMGESAVANQENLGHDGSTVDHSQPGIDPNYGDRALATWVSKTLQQEDSWDTKENAENALVKA
ncbi:hypothetical protein N7456_006167 [Penicillium angulare]|uniref:Uncharacterized protein n=1 Tax=Penicillium angulare TaxID=116970 RepID=A0A9W9G1F9_9EURO|nr:hypothetical protein N7456_006167 [Penicillium angulare]